MSRLIELREKQVKLVADARAKLDEIKPDTPAARAAELEAEHDRIFDEVTRLDGLVKREEQLAEREAALERGDPRRPVGEDRTAEPAGDAPKATVETAFRSWLRYGAGGLLAEERTLLQSMRVKEPERRAQAAGTDAAGGYLVPQGFVAELIKSLKAFGPMVDPGITRQLETAAGNQIDWPTMNDTANKGAILAENAQDTEQDVAFGSKQLDAFKYTTKIIRVSEELMQDAAIDIEQIVRDAGAERLGRIVNEHMTVGTGVGQPSGIVTASTQGFVAAAAANITFDDLIELQHAIDPAYRADPSTRWMFHDNTLKRLRKLKDVEGNYIWQPADVRSGAPAVILDHPYSINQDMPQVGASAKSVLFGAFNRYVVRRVRELALKRLVERYADFHQVGFIGFARFDGDLLNADAVKHLAHPAA
ncbi:MULTISPECIES: phage major capsid protein [Rhodomicrobium]|uniref:phage major capsid protein n=1 Tax=Rhodomicrobium TaxID=1068 RepID=UPI000B4C065C|nr:MULTISPECIES: phage major capsid protein [Rhodomicrobium]